MKRKIIFGLLVVVFLLFFITSSWALDYKRYKFEGWPEQERVIVPVVPQTIDSYPLIIKSVFILNYQNVPALIFIDKSSNQVPAKTEKPVKSSTSQIREEDER
jgi:hypothetical protein